MISMFVRELTAAATRRIYKVCMCKDHYMPYERGERGEGRRETGEGRQESMCVQRSSYSTNIFRLS